MLQEFQLAPARYFRVLQLVLGQHEADREPHRALVRHGHAADAGAGPVAVGRGAAHPQEAHLEHHVQLLHEDVLVGVLLLRAAPQGLDCGRGRRKRSIS